MRGGCKHSRVRASVRETEMEVELRFSVFLLLIQVSLAVWQHHVTVSKGHTLRLSCPVTDAHKTNVEWKNPEEHVMFFNQIQALGDKRYSINKLSESKFTMSISNVTFKDGGIYTCSQYGDHTTEKKVEVTVLGRPTCIVKKEVPEGRFCIECTAEGNRSPPQIFWKLDGGPEIIAVTRVLHEDKKYVSTDMLCVQSVKNRVTVKCIVRHPALHSKIRMKRVKIGRNSRKSQHTTTTRSPTARPPGSPEAQRTTRHITTRDLKGPSSEGPKLSTDPTTQLFSSSEPLTVTSAQNSSSTHSHLSDNSTRRRNDTISNATSATATMSQHTTLTRSPTAWPPGSTEAQRTRYITTRDLKGPSSEGPAELGPSTQLFSSSEPETVTSALNLASSKHSTLSNTSWTSVSETTENTSNNHTEGNKTDILNDPRMRTGGSSLLVFLVTCLIFGLLVVIIFFAIKLRRAHITWKRENEDSDPSEESSKSKSSQEERNSQGQRRRGFFNTAFTQYVVEKPTVITSVTNTAAMAEAEGASKEKNSQHPTPGQTSTKCDIKETEL
ncbi:cytotoxic and regulatory T-cell molecule isoform X2 [Notothenia coriiceps]|uniref:Cytotoxic and regulatory T-cell molecule isoform X2 n=1 Tax=Notothenia coriiceps TaxID=8208 RepID=A0A6I9NWX6_9TELE|nr:PREDICTED: cytotoxic and regulatory T-cell molecule isoform X2 [Notothenia coriiceps]